MMWMTRDKVPMHTRMLPVFMPVDAPSCQYCFALEYDRARDVRFCRATGEVIRNFKTDIGEWCPIEDER